ncbi:MAG: L,D-transpeptidase [Pseudomonadota bacterium]
MTPTRSFTRRALIATGAAALAAPAIAQTTQFNYNVPQENMPTLVQLDRGWAAGEIQVVPSEFALYWTLPEGRAIKYIVGIGRPGLYESGTFRVGAKKEWPRWTPTAAMIEREPEIYKQHEDGMEGGPENPLGSRALYLFDGGRDTFLRIHGTPVPWSMRTRNSNGCVRMVNAHVADLYQRVPRGARVVLG